MRRSPEKHDTLPSQFAERAVKGYQNEAFRLCKGCQVGIRPLLRGKLDRRGKFPKLILDSIRVPLGIEGDARVTKELIVDFPSLPLGLDLILHYDRVGKQAKKAQLGQAAKHYGFALESTKDEWIRHQSSGESVASVIVCPDRHIGFLAESKMHRNWSNIVR